MLRVNELTVRGVKTPLRKPTVGISLVAVVVVVVVRPCGSEDMVTRLPWSEVPIVRR